MLLHERPARAVVVLGAVAIVGVGLVVTTGSQRGSNPTLGLIVSIGNLLLWVVWSLAIKDARTRRVDTATWMLCANVGALVRTRARHAWRTGDGRHGRTRRVRREPRELRDGARRWTRLGRDGSGRHHDGRARASLRLGFFGASGESPLVDRPYGNPDQFTFGLRVDYTFKTKPLL